MSVQCFSKKKSKLQKEIDSNKFYIKKDSAGKYFFKHNYYYQIQGQLNITGISECILIVFVPVLQDGYAAKIMFCIF